MKQFKLFAAAAICCLLLAGCQSGESPSSSADSAAASQPQSSAGESSASAEPKPASGESRAGETAALYIGDTEVGFKEYPLPLEGELTPEALIGGIADLTGWDMTLADQVSTGKGGMTVCFASSSALFVGPPENQREEFHMFAADQLAQTVLDSVKKTLQVNFTGAGGNPDALDIYYCMEGTKPITLPNLGLTIPMDQPYSWDSVIWQTEDQPDGQTGDEANAYLVEYLKEALEPVYGDLSGARFREEPELVEIDGMRCAVIEVILDGSSLGYYAIGEGQSGLYQFNTQTAEYEPFAKG